jgi:hypothetical protein
MLPQVSNEMVVLFKEFYAPEKLFNIRLSEEERNNSIVYYLF